MRNIIEQYKQIVDSYPDAIAIEEGSKKIPHQELWDLASRYAQLLDENIPSNSLVELFMQKSIRYIAAILGCWMHGCYFIPIPNTLPEKRIAFICPYAIARRVCSREAYSVSKRTGK